MQVLAALLRWAMNGLTHSALVTLDSGSADSPTMDVQDSDGRSLGEALLRSGPTSLLLIHAPIWRVRYASTGGYLTIVGRAGVWPDSVQVFGGRLS